MATHAGRRTGPVARTYRRPMIRLAKALIGLAVGALALAVGGYAAFVFFEGHPPRTLRTERVCTQPGDVTYVDGTYGVFLAEDRVALSLDEQAPRAVVGRSSDHGVPVVLADGTGADDVTCSWDTEGVTISDGAGVSHRVPASVFTGGR